MAGGSGASEVVCKACRQQGERMILSFSGGRLFFICRQSKLTNPRVRDPNNRSNLIFLFLVLFKEFYSIGANCRTDAAVVPLMEFKVVVLFPLVTFADIQNLFPRDAWIPALAGQGIGRTGFHTLSAATAVMAFFGWPACQCHIREDRAQADSGPIGPRDQLAVAADPTQACQGGGGFVGKIPFDVFPIRAQGGSQRQGSTSPCGDCVSQRR